MKAMAMKPEDRYQAVRDFLMDFVGEQAASGEVMSSSVQQEKGKTTALPVVLAIIALSIIIMIAILLLRKSKDEEKGENMVNTENDTVEVVQVPIYHLYTGEEFTYKGELDSLGVPNGHGTAIFIDRVYDGNFVNGNMNGLGELTFTMGSKAGRVIKARFVDNRICDTCTVVSGPNVFKGTLTDDMDYDCGIQTNPKVGKKYKIESGEIKEVIEIK